MESRTCLNFPDSISSVQDSGDALEDFWESTSTYLSDDFSDGPLPERTVTGPFEQQSSGEMVVLYSFMN